MNYIFKILSLSILLCAYFSASSQCSYEIKLQDSNNNGWDGASLDVHINGELLSNFTLQNATLTSSGNKTITRSDTTTTTVNGSTVTNITTSSFTSYYTLDAKADSGTVTFTTDSAAIVKLTFKSGSSDQEISYQVSVGGSQLLSVASPNAVAGVVLTDTCKGSDKTLIVVPGTGSGCATITSFPYQEDFSSSTSTDCWEAVTTGTFPAWRISNISGEATSSVSPSFFGNTQSDLLVSPKITLTGQESLHFKHRSDAFFGSATASYEVLISTTGKAIADFTTVIGSGSTNSSTYVQAPAINLAAYTGDVYIAFRYTNEQGFNSYKIDDVEVKQSTASNQRVLNTTTVNKASNIASLKVYPNPSTGLVYANVALLENYSVQVEITNVAGQIVQSFAPRKGFEQNYEIDLSSQASGVYFAKFILQDEVLTTKIVIE